MNKQTALRVQVHLFKAARNAINITHVSGTKGRSTLTCTEFSHLKMIEEGIRR